jgi:hypothetical protein
MEPTLTCPLCSESFSAPSKPDAGKLLAEHKKFVHWKSKPVVEPSKPVETIGSTSTYVLTHATSSCLDLKELLCTHADDVRYDGILADASAPNGVFYAVSCLDTLPETSPYPRQFPWTIALRATIPIEEILLYDESRSPYHQQFSFFRVIKPNERIGIRQVHIFVATTAKNLAWARQQVCANMLIPLVGLTEVNFPLYYDLLRHKWVANLNNNRIVLNLFVDHPQMLPDSTSWDRVNVIPFYYGKYHLEENIRCGASGVYQIVSLTIHKPNFDGVEEIDFANGGEYNDCEEFEEDDYDDHFFDFGRIESNDELLGEVGEVLLDAGFTAEEVGAMFHRASEDLKSHRSSIRYFEVGYCSTCKLFGICENCQQYHSSHKMKHSGCTREEPHCNGGFTSCFPDWDSQSPPSLPNSPSKGCDDSLLTIIGESDSSFNVAKLQSQFDELEKMEIRLHLLQDAIFLAEFSNSEEHVTRLTLRAESLKSLLRLLRQRKKSSFNQSLLDLLEDTIKKILNVKSRFSFDFSIGKIDKIDSDEEFY